MATATELSTTTKTTEIAYSPTEQQIEGWREQYMPLAITDLKDGAMVKTVHEARMTLRAARIHVEKTRVALKAEALAYGRTVDSEARRITALIEPIEQHLADEEAKVEAEKARVKKEKEDAARAIVEQRIRALAAVNCHPAYATVQNMSDQQFADALGDATFEFNAAKQKAAEEEAARKAESERLAKEKAELDRQRAEQEAEKQRLADEQAKLDAEKKRIADKEAEKARAAENKRLQDEAAERSRIETEQRIAREQAEAKAKAEREAAAKAKAESEEAERVKLQAEAEEAARVKAEAMRPDREKLLSFADQVAALQAPALSEASQDFQVRVARLIENAAYGIRMIVGQM